MSYPPNPKKVAYVVLEGRTPGIYESWEEARSQVEGYQGACFRGYFTYEAAVEVWEAFEYHGENRIRQRAIGSAGKLTKRGRIESRDRMPGIDCYARELVRKFTKPDGSGEHYMTVP